MLAATSSFAARSSFTLRIPSKTTNCDESPVLSDCAVDDAPAMLLEPARPTLRAVLVLIDSDGRNAPCFDSTVALLEATAFSDCLTSTLWRSARAIASWRPIFAPGAGVCAPTTAGETTTAATRSARLHLDADIYDFMGIT